MAQLNMWKQLGAIASLIPSLLLGVSLFPSSVYALELGVSPPRFELPIEAEGTTESIRVFNMSAEPMEIHVSVQHWTLDESNQVQIIPPTEQSLDQWILINPMHFTIPAGQSQTIRFAIRPRVQPTPGEHRAIIYFEQVPPANRPANGMVTVGQVGVAVYGYVGEVQRVGILNRVQVQPSVNPVTAFFHIASQGTANVRMEGQYAVWAANQYPGASATTLIPNLGEPDAALPASILEAGFLPATPVLPNMQRQIPLQMTRQLPPGNYVLDLNGMLGEQALDEGIPFTVPAR